jgi:CubicO group peptidase (beta-lactamase class C family)
VTKQFTAAAILLLQEQGKLSIDDLVSEYLPDPPTSWEKITIYHLLTHTSGLPNFTAQPDYGKWKREPDAAAETLARIRDLPLDFEPGEEFRYSNSGYIMLGYIVELASEQSYEAFLTENIFKPVGMKDSGYDSNSAIIPHRASGYTPGPSGLVNATYIDMRVPGGAGALYSTTHDLLLWTRSLFGGKVLSPESLETMTTPFKDDYACGLFVKTVDGRKVIAHGGGIDGFNSELAYYPDEGLTVVVLANVNGSAASEMAGQLPKVAFGEPVTLPGEREATDVPTDILRQYVGAYQLAPNVTNTIRLVDDHLTTQLPNQPEIPLFPESETKFFLKVVNAQVEFFKDASGRVTHLIIYQNGRQQTAQRVGGRD